MKTLAVLIILFAMNIHMVEGKINEKWVLSDTIPNKKSSLIEFEFRPNGTFNYKGEHSNAWHSSAEGTYHYQKETNEIFILAEHGNLDWIQQMYAENIPLYYGNIYSNYQLYFKIINRTDSTITVMEYINSYHEDMPDETETDDMAQIWDKKDGKYKLIATDKNRMKEYTFSLIKQ